MNTDKLMELVEKFVARKRREADEYDEQRSNLTRFDNDHKQMLMDAAREARADADELAAALRAEQAVGDEQIARDERNTCDCHPETCGCPEWRVVLDGKFFIGGNRETCKTVAAAMNTAFDLAALRALGAGRQPENLGEFVISLLVAGGYVTQAKVDEARKIALSHGPYEMPARQSEGAVVPNGLRVIGELLRTQDNRITDSPIFIVQQKREHVADPDYDCDRIVWVGEDNTELSAEESAAAEEHFKAEYEAPEGLRRLAVRFEWEFVTACFTEQGCKDYLARDGHNLKEPRIYASGSYRNEEFRAVRKFLMSLAAAPGGEGEG